MLTLTDITIRHILELFFNSKYSYESAISVEDIKTCYASSGYHDPDLILIELIYSNILYVSSFEDKTTYVALTKYGRRLCTEIYGKIKKKKSLSKRQK